MALVLADEQAKANTREVRDRARRRRIEQWEEEQALEALHEREKYVLQ